MTTDPTALPADFASEMHRPTVAVVPVAGHGTRLRPLSAYIPKELLPVGGRLALWRIVDELIQAGIESVIFIVSPEKRPFVEKCFSAPSEPGDTLNVSPFGADAGARIRFEYIVQPAMRGLGDAVLRAAGTVGERPFLIALGDAVYEEPQTGGLTRRLIDAFTEHRAAVALAVQPVAPERISRYGVVRPVSGSEGTGSNISNIIPIDDIVEKPLPSEAPSRLAAAARYVVAPEVFRVLEQTEPDAKGEVQLTHALRSLLQQQKTGIAVPLHPGEIRHDIGSLDSYYRAFAAFALNDAEQGSDFRDFLLQRMQESEPPCGEHSRDKGVIGRSGSVDRSTN